MPNVPSNMLDTVVSIGGLVLALSLILAGWKAGQWLRDFIAAQISGLGKEFRENLGDLEERFSSQLGDFRQEVQKALSAQRKENNESIAEVRSAIRTLEKDFIEHKISDAQTYVTKDDLNMSLHTILTEIRAGRSEEVGRLTRLEAMLSAKTPHRP